MNILKTSDDTWQTQLSKEESDSVESASRWCNFNEELENGDKRDFHMSGIGRWTKQRSVTPRPCHNWPGRPPGWFKSCVLSTFSNDAMSKSASVRVQNVMMFCITEHDSCHYNCHYDCHDNCLSWCVIFIFDFDFGRMPYFLLLWHVPQQLHKLLVRRLHQACRFPAISILFQYSIAKSSDVFNWFQLRGLWKQVTQQLVAARHMQLEA